MKRILFFSLLFVSVFALAHGQNKEAQGNFKEIYFYGVDYSKVKVLNSPETPTQFKVAFQEINDLFYKETKKYNVEKYFRKVVLGRHLEAVKDRIEEMKEDDLKTSDPNYKIDRPTLETMVKTLPVKETEGAGLIIVAEKLNKDQLRGYYHMVYFDIKTRQILDTWEEYGKCRGFGLRNYWAYSVLKAMQSVRFK